jgi:hypothetical protein
MINGSFTDSFQVQQFNQPGINFDNAHDKTTVECWYIPRSTEEADSITKNRQFTWPKEQWQTFTVGSVINKASELQEGQQYTFFLFKVVIGRAYVHKGELKPDSFPSIPEGYDSVYLADDSHSKGVYQHRYLIFDP